MTNKELEAHERRVNLHMTLIENQQKREEEHWTKDKNSGISSYDYRR